MGDLFSVRGRIGRGRLLAVLAVVSLLSSWVYFNVTFLDLAGKHPVVAWSVRGVVGAVCVGIWIPHVIRRLHDLGLPGARFWLTLVPGYGIPYVLLLKKGTEGRNQYGEDSREGAAIAGTGPLFSEQGAAGPSEYGEGAEQEKRAMGPRSVLRGVGSLWFAGVLLVLALFAMACATVYESTHGAARALATFYHTWWFTALLALLATNVLAAMLVRFPFSRRQFGFVLTHASILVILGGALVSEHWGIEGQVAIREGKTATEFKLRGQEALTVVRHSDADEYSIDLPRGVFGGFDTIDDPNGPTLRMPLKDVGEHREGKDKDEDKLQITAKRYLSDGVNEYVVVQYEGDEFEFVLASCMSKWVKTGDSGYKMKVRRYFPHAIPGRDGTIHNMTDNPVNPAIEVEVVGAGKHFSSFAFAKEPEFWSKHAGKVSEGLDVGFVIKDEYAPAPVIRANRQQAILVEWSTKDHEGKLWLPKYAPRRLLIHGETYWVSYGDKSVPLDVELTLNDFHMGRYPGTERPQSFESHVTVLDPVRGKKQGRVVSMNRPVKFGGYTIFQSSYYPDEKGSILSVSRDPGLPIVFVGYVVMMVGMVWVLVQRMQERRRRNR